MLFYMAVPVLIMFGLCILFYMAGRYVRLGKKPKEAKVPETIKESEPPKEPDRVPILEEEIGSLKEALEIKNRELEDQNKAAESLMQENRRLLAQVNQGITDKRDEPKEAVESDANLNVSLLQLEEEKSQEEMDKTDEREKKSEDDTELNTSLSQFEKETVQGIINKTGNQTEEADKLNAILSQLEKEYSQEKKDKTYKADKIGGHPGGVEDAVKLNASLSQTEKESAAHNIAALLASSSREDALKESAKNMKNKKPKQKMKIKKPAKNIRRKNPKQKSPHKRR